MEGIESNQGLLYGGTYGVRTAVQGTFHQGNSRFSETAGIKCTSNAYFAIMFSTIKTVSLWKAI